ncbi:ANTAR domain-containing protein [Alkalibaculum sp. M08DMB]|uniref:Stage 0 sporulation protein A homolog n=1 Tax=Alkalibaculum sporogenes TaxID=2655001 RepID=A0A6A7K678_9FIRM|nr:ANTAR domain-containing protein [Alkalibaculum sporogenes]MPW24892.1 ANTAR domain-containing protein [Alkalibaculum sporogenes]
MLQNIILCINNKTNENSITSNLKKIGYNVLICDDGNSLIRMARSRNIDLVLLDDEVKGIRAIDIVNIISSEKICPVVIMSNQYGTDYLNWIEKGWVYTYVNVPLERYELLKVVQGAIATGQRLLELEREIQKLRNEIAQRKTIEKAKGIVMEKRKCCEDDAYKYLRKTSMDKGISIENISLAIINKYCK